jgi:hypothetical protein
MSSNTIHSSKGSFKTHSNYIRAIATLINAETQEQSHSIYPALANKVVRSGCLPNTTKDTIDHTQIISSLRNAWGTELLINISNNICNEPELVKLSNNWSTVQAYYVLYHSTQAVAVAKGYRRLQSHSKTQKTFYNLWAGRNLQLEPWTLAYDSEGAQNIPSDITIDDTMHTWCHCSSDTAWSLACKALKTTREENFPESIKNSREEKRRLKTKSLQQDEAERIRLGKNPKKTYQVRLPLLTPTEKSSVYEKEPPATIIDYLYRLRVKTNYIDSSMFTDGPENEYASIQVRDDLSIIAGGTLLLAELTVSKVVGNDVFLGWINDWVCDNVPVHGGFGIRDRLRIYTL